MLVTWTLVVFLNGQPFVSPTEFPTLEACSAMGEQALVSLVSTGPDNPDQHNNTSCGRTDLSVFKPARK